MILSDQPLSLPFLLFVCPFLSLLLSAYHIMNTFSLYYQFFPLHRLVLPENSPKVRSLIPANVRARMGISLTDWADIYVVPVGVNLTKALFLS